MQKMPPATMGRKRMWACRLSEEDLEKLSAIAKAESRRKTDVIRWLIENYYKEHVEGREAKPKKTSRN